MKERRKRWRETLKYKRYIHLVASHTLPTGDLVQPRHVPQPGTEPATFQFTGWRSTHWATPAREALSFFFLKFAFINFRERKGENIDLLFHSSTHSLVGYLCPDWGSNPHLGASGRRSDWAARPGQCWHSQCHQVAPHSSVLCAHCDPTTRCGYQTCEPCSWGRLPSASCAVYLVFTTLLSPFIELKSLVWVVLVPIYGILETPQWPKRTGNHNKAELPAYLWPYHLTGKVEASPSLFITLHQLSILWKLLLDTQLPRNHRE